MKKHWASVFAGCWLLLSCAVPGLAVDCKQAASAIDKAVCSEPKLLQLDTELNHLYAEVRPQLSAKARSELLTQQRAWLAGRNRECASGVTECLLKQYRSRVDELTALKASADSINDPLNDATPVMVTGAWKVTAIHDPANAGAGSSTDAVLQESLKSADLPGVGSVINAAPGKLCLPQQDCDPMGWTQTTLDKVVGAPAIEHWLGLSSELHVFQGSSGTTRSYYLLVPQSDKTVWVVFAVCGPQGENCRQAAEVWTPASEDATVRPHP